VSENKLLIRQMDLRDRLKQLHNKKLHNLYPSPNIPVIKSMRMGKARHLTIIRW